MSNIYRTLEKSPHFMKLQILSRYGHKLPLIWFYERDQRKVEYICEVKDYYFFLWWERNWHWIPQNPVRLYLAWSISQHVLLSLPVKGEERPYHSMMLPPPFFTYKMLCSRRKLFATHGAFGSRWKSSLLILSDTSTFYHIVCSAISFHFSILCYFVLDKSKCGIVTWQM